MDQTNAPPPIQAPAPTPPVVPVPRKRKGRGWIWLVVVLLLLGAGGAVAYYLKTRTPAIAVQTSPVTRRNLTEVVVATGKIQPVVLVKISPEVSGEIIELPVKEGQTVKKGDLLLRIKPDFYTANRNSAQANYAASRAGNDLARANLEKADAELKRARELFGAKLISDSEFLDVRTAYDVAKAQLETASHQSDVAKASLARATEELAKTTIVSPLDGTITKLNSQAGERVVGTATMAGTEVMSIANLEDMEARVEIGEVDIVLIDIDQKAALDVDAFRDRKFTGTVYEIANTAKTTQAGQQQEATKFEVKIRINEKGEFRPGMSVTADIETRYRTNVLTVPIQCVTTRMPKGAASPKPPSPQEEQPDLRERKKKPEDTIKPIEVVFVVKDDEAKMVPVTRGISDDSYVEIEKGLTEGQSVVSGSYKAINRELEDGKKIKATNPKSQSPKS